MTVLSLTWESHTWKDGLYIEIGPWSSHTHDPLGGSPFRNINAQSRGLPVRFKAGKASSWTRAPYYKNSCSYIESYLSTSQFSISRARWPFQKQVWAIDNIWELTNFQHCTKIAFFIVWIIYLMWNFKGTLWNSTQSILLVHWKVCSL